MKYPFKFTHIKTQNICQNPPQDKLTLNYHTQAKALSENKCLTRGCHRLVFDFNFIVYLSAVALWCAPSSPPWQRLSLLAPAVSRLARPALPFLFCHLHPASHHRDISEFQQMQQITCRFRLKQKSSYQKVRQFILLYQRYSLTAEYSGLNNIIMTDIGSYLAPVSCTDSMAFIGLQFWMILMRKKTLVEQIHIYLSN